MHFESETTDVSVLGMQNTAIFYYKPPLPWAIVLAEEVCPNPQHLYFVYSPTEN